MLLRTTDQLPPWTSQYERPYFSPILFWQNTGMFTDGQARTCTHNNILPSVKQLTQNSIVLNISRCINS